MLCYVSPALILTLCCQVQIKLEQPEEEEEEEVVEQVVEEEEVVEEVEEEGVVEDGTYLYDDVLDSCDDGGVFINEVVLGDGTEEAVEETEHVVEV